jgi:hypothetical protein
VSSRRRCLDDGELAAVVDGTASAEERTHLTKCERCRRSHELIVELIRTSGGSAEAADDALSAVEKQGRQCVSRLEGTVAPHRWNLAASREMASPSVVSAMLDRFEILMDAASPEALSMANAAVTVAALTAALLDDSGASLRCRAFKAKAVVLTSFACYDDAAEALDEGADAARDVADMASIAYARAWLLGNPDVWRPAEALALLDSHFEVFERISPGKHRAALLLRAGIIMRQGYFAEAEAELHRLRSAVEMSSERAMVSLNLGTCRLRQGDPGSCLQLARESAGISRSLGPAGAILLLQAEWVISDALGACGELEQGAAIARRVADAFGRLHLDENSVRAELTFIRLMLAWDPDVDVREACEGVLRLCSRWPSPRAACAAEALQYLRDMANKRAATFDDATTVELYIRSLRTATPVRFRPPMPLVAM